MTTTKRITLAQRPSGLPDDSTWATEEVDLPAPADGELLVKHDHISLDPAMRGWMNEGKSYVRPVAIGEVMRAGGIGIVEESKSPKFAAGDTVMGVMGVQRYWSGPADDRGAGRAALSARMRGFALIEVQPCPSSRSSSSAPAPPA